MLIFGKLGNVQPMAEHKFRVHVLETVVTFTLAPFPKALPHLVAVLLQFSGVDALRQKVGKLPFLFDLLLDLGFGFMFLLRDVIGIECGVTLLAWQLTHSVA